MPFCRECRKEVQEDWVTCPYCSKSIGPPLDNTMDVQMNVQDSVVAGDVNIIQNVNSNQGECPICGSKNVEIYSCIKEDCKESFCTVCTRYCYISPNPKYLKEIKQKGKRSGLKRSRYERYATRLLSSDPIYRYSKGPFCQKCVEEEVEIILSEFEWDYEN